ncbi:NOB1 family endonuclease [Halarchaeum salinum]|uniref:NOB1 family endonuclease n=1 Tax=Halarchaeum salinum TaxID=489912 RepID=A0AAV3S6U8_9EURY
MHVLDSSAFIDEYDVEGPAATVPGVREELKDAASYRLTALEGSGMRVHVPDEAAIRRVEDAATRTGDADVLSETDVRVLAAALELDAVLVTDDYAMQNVADALDLSVESVSKEGITERRDWNFQCQGCGREFDEDRERCPVCGSDLARKNPN